MKKTLAIILAGLLTLSFAACGNTQEDNKNNDDSAQIDQNVIEEATSKGTFEYALNDKGDYEITNYEPYSITAANITLPTEVNGIKIVGIAANAFNAENSIKSVTIPDTYTYISDYAFYDCDSLKSVTLPSTIEKIGTSVFQSCDVLETIKIPAAVTEIPAFAFKDCKAITSLDLTNVEKIQKGAFFNCTSLEAITVSNKLEYATRDAFVGCSSLKYNVEENLLYLGDNTNKYVLLVQPNPEAITLDECVVSNTTKVIADYAFDICKDLKKITLSDSVKVINGTAFTSCTELAYNKSENGLYLGTAENPYMVLIDLDVTSVEDFKLNKDTKIIAKTAFAKTLLLEDISFDGTKEEWTNIIKAEDWYGDLNISITLANGETFSANEASTEE